MTENRFKAILADLDGTIIRGDNLIPGAHAVYQELSDKGFKWLFLSNNATVLAHEIAQELRTIGFPVSDGQVVNSADAIIRGLSTERPDARVFLVGQPSLRVGIQEAGITVVEDPFEADVVVGALDKGFTYEKLVKAQAAIHRGADFWATNTDPSLPVAEGLRPGAGSIIAAIATAAGRQPDRIFGKPYADMAEIALQILGLERESCMVVGDRMDTDILFARNSGMVSALVLTGATSREDLARFPFEPDYVLESIAQMSEALFDGRPL